MGERISHSEFKKLVLDSQETKKLNNEEKTTAFFVPSKGHSSEDLETILNNYITTNSISIRGVTIARLGVGVQVNGDVPLVRTLYNHLINGYGYPKWLS